MWIYTNQAFLSIMADKDGDQSKLLVRASQAGNYGVPMAKWYGSSRVKRPRWDRPTAEQKRFAEFACSRGIDTCVVQ